MWQRSNVLPVLVEEACLQDGGAKKEGRYKVQLAPV